MEQGGYRCYKNMDYTKPLGQSVHEEQVTVEGMFSRLTRPIAGCRQDKHCLDIYLPSNHTASREDASIKKAVPLVVFVHGGGWRRGDRQGWRHYISDSDTNILMAFIFWVFGLYGSVGETLAGSGVACAVVSYPLSRLTFPRCLVEQLTSFGMSQLPLWLLLWLCVFLFSVFMPHGELSLTNQSCLNFTIHLHPGVLSFLLAMVLRWVVMGRRLLGDGTLLVRTCEWLCLFIILTVCSCTIYFLCVHKETEHSKVQLMLALVLPPLTAELLFVHMYLLKAPITHPDHVRAIASCVSWLLQVGRAAPGVFDTSGVFLMGHSAGGHLVSLLTIHDTFLQEVGLDRRIIKGVMSISGVYDLSWLACPPLQQYYLLPAFGPCHDTWWTASPLTILRQENEADKKPEVDQSEHLLPPFLICSAALELPGLTEQARDFTQELWAKGTCVTHHVIANTNHFFIMPKLKPQSQLERLCLDFVREYSRRPACH